MPKPPDRTAPEPLTAGWAELREGRWEAAGALFRGALADEETAARGRGSPTGQPNATRAPCGRSATTTGSPPKRSGGSDRCWSSRVASPRASACSTWRRVEADGEALPFGDEEFDVVTSSVGAIFAPDHQAVADELVRVCRPGGTIGMINFVPDGVAVEFFELFGRYAPAPPPGALPPVLWGSEEHVRELFGDRLASLELTRGEYEYVLVVGQRAPPERPRGTMPPCGWNPSRATG